MSLINFNGEIEDLDNKENKILYFNSPFCGQCFGLKTKLENISLKYPSIKLYSINVKDRNNIGEKYKIQILPYLLFIKNGIITDNITGNISEEILEKKFKEF